MMKSRNHTHARAAVIAVTVTCVVLMSLCPAPAGAWQSSMSLDRFVIVKYRSGSASVAEVALRSKRTLVRRELLGGGVLMQVPDDVSMTEFIEQLSALPGVEYAEPESQIEPVWTPGDPEYYRQWALPHIQAPDVWDVTLGDAAVTVALLDTGVDLDHPDLVGNLLGGGYDFGENDADPNDRSGHGTHCAGIIVAESDNGIGVAGLAPGVGLLPVKVFTDSGYGNTSMLADGIRFATDAGADIISMSLGGTGTTSYLEQAVIYARDHGVLLVAAAGNSGSEGLLYPARSEGVIGVVATTEADLRAPYSNYGPEVDLAAPGSSVYSTIIGAYGYKSGTSMATPYVSGALALLRSAWPAATTEQLVASLVASAVDMDTAGWDRMTGFGRIQVDDALTRLGGAHSWDATAPVTASNAVESYLHAATITLKPTDVGGSGVAYTRYSLDGSAEASGTTVVVTGYGEHTLAYRSVDYAGNPERTNSVSFSILENPGPVVTRVAGDTRYETCVEMSKAAFEGSTVPTVVVASGEQYADALTASSLAGAYDSPLLLTARKVLPEVVESELGRLGARHVLLVGGTGAVTAEVEETLVLSGVTVERVAGVDRYETACEVARAVRDRMGTALSKTVLLARGDDFADALSLAPLSAGRRMPLLLTRTAELPAVTADMIEDLGTGYVVVAGGIGAVSDDVLDAVDEIPGIISVTRAFGADRYGTSVAVADYALSRGWATTHFIGLGTGATFPDALAGGVVAGSRSGVVLLSRRDVLPDVTRTFIEEQPESAVSAWVFGGVSAISDDVLDEVAAIRF